MNSMRSNCKAIETAKRTVITGRAIAIVERTFTIKGEKVAESIIT